jgi:transglutaminase-like putative cysteine protease
MPHPRTWSLLTIVLGIVAAALKLAFAALAIATPVLAIWTASSLTAYHGGRVWLAALVGALVFPGLPVLWELASMWRRARAGDKRPPILTWFDRFVLRTLVVGLGFSAIVLVRDASTVFTALSTRGDWMLDGREGPMADSIRTGLVRAAKTLEWLHEATHRNRYSELIDDAATKTDSEVKPVEDDFDAVIDALRRRMPAPSLPTPTDDTPPEPAKFVARSDGWPFVAELHPAVLSIPASVETSPEAIGRHLAAVEPDPKLRLKAAHDYVADRIAYDAVALAEGRYPDQSATTVLANRIGVCAGYANLLAEIGTAAGIETIVVRGDARTGADGFGDGGHAWNAARLGHEWVLLDATWDSGHVSGREFEKEYSTEYLMAPPAAFGLTHLPDEDRWQLRNQPLSRAEFLRQPALKPDFYARGLRLRTPDGPVVDATDSLDIVIDNPLGLELRVDIALPDAQSNFDWCEGSAPASCRFTKAGTYDVRIFSESTYLGEIRVHATG